MLSKFVGQGANSGAKSHKFRILRERNSEQCSFPERCLLAVLATSHHSFWRIWEKIMQKKRFIRQMIAFAVLAAMLGGAWLALSGGEVAAPENPLQERNENRSHMLQQDTITMQMAAEAPAPEEEKPTATPEPSAAPTQTPKPSEQPKPTVEPTAKATEVYTSEPTPNTANQPTKKPANTAKATQKTAPILTPKPDESANDNGAGGTGDEIKQTTVVYFTTTIINGSTIPDRELDFSISHKQPSLKPLSTDVEVNGSRVNQFNGRVQLQEGQNSIKITVVYSDAEEHRIEVSKTYTVFVVPDELIITTDLQDRTVNQKSFSFTAYASFGSRKASLSAYANGEKLESASNRFKAVLNEGANEIRIAADGEGRHIEQSFTITVEMPDEIEFITDLYDHEVEDPNFSFQAALSGGTERATLTVVANGVTLNGENGSYSCVLSRGNNLIRLKAADADGREFTQIYTIAYHRYVVSESGEADDSMPILSCNISDGMSITGSIYTLQVAAQTGAGERIYADHITVQLNGRSLENLWQDDLYTGYRLELTGGENDVVITVWDYEDRYTIYRFKINCTIIEEGGKKGTAQVIVDANVIGLGELISSTSVDIFEGQNAVYALAQVLEAKGFQYQYSGNLTNGFYLAHLLKSGITNGWTIPEALEDAINEEGLMWTNIYHNDSLGEYDFTQGSGWMYSVNGVYPNYSLSECYLQDGDVVRLRYTLAYGKDIGGSDAQGGGDNYEQQW